MSLQNTARYRPRLENGEPVATPGVQFSQPWILLLPIPGIPLAVRARRCGQLVGILGNIADADLARTIAVAQSSSRPSTRTRRPAPGSR